MAKKQDLSPEELLEQALVPESEWPYEVPENWVWTKLDNIINIKTGKKDANYGTENGKYLFFTCAAEPLRCDGFSFDGESILLAGNGANVGLALYYNGQFEAYQRTYVLQGYKSISLKYIYYHLKGFWKDYNSDKQYGSATNYIKLGNFQDYPLPLPPFAEQQRIVNRVESLFEKLDQAEGLIQEALDSFENRKAAILHKAFTGELTKKWREENKYDSPEVIYNNVIEQHYGTGSLNKDISVYLENLDLESTTDEKNWLHLKTMILCENITCGNTPTGYFSQEGDIPFLKVYNISDNEIDFQYKPQYISANIHYGRLKSSILKPQDVVMNIVGPPLRKIALIPKDFNEWNMNQAIVRFRTIQYLEPKYFYYCLINPNTLEEIIRDTKGVVGQANISITQSRNLVIPVPSNQEQKEIIRLLDNFIEKEKKAKELYDVIDHIDTIKKSILARTFRGELGTNKPDEESALELLKAILKE